MTTDKAQYMVEIRVSGVPVRFRIDTGADISVINGHTLDLLGLRGSLQQAEMKVLDAGGCELEDEGRVEVRMDYGGLRRRGVVHVVEKAPQNLLGIPELEGFKLVARVGGARKIEERFPRLYGPLGLLPDKFSIKLKEGAIPFSLAVPRRLPLGLKEATEKELERMEALGVIEKVEEPREWCAGMVVAPKSSGGVRVCVDLTVLNKSVRRENFPLPRVDETLAALQKGRVFSKMDANSGFWQIELEETSRPLTTFITPFGRFQFKKMPFGISAAPEFFQRQMSKILQGVEGVVCMMDDVLVYGESEGEHDRRLELVMRKLEEAGMTLNRSKCEFRVSEVTFLGHKVGERGISPDPAKLAAIRDMRAPTNKSELKSFLGMVNFLSKFSPRLAELERPLRELQKKSSDWVWDVAQRESFSKVKEEICTAPVLAKYDLRAKHRVSADSSSYALGAVLLQRGEKGDWRPVSFISRKLSEAERRYAQIEKEALAVTWACERFDFYLVGTDFEVETDHKPLVRLLGEKDLANLPLRCQRFKLRLMRYRFDIFHTPGSQMFLADALSRPAGATTEQERARGKRVEVHLRAVKRAEELLDDGMLEDIKQCAHQDPLYQMVLEEVDAGWTRKGRSYKGELHSYWTQKDSLTSIRGLLMREEALVIPERLRKGMMEKIHRGHQGIARCLRRAQGSVWWPGIRRDVTSWIEGCNVCTRHRQIRHQPLLTTELPEGPWECLGSDLFEFQNRDFLLVVDYYSRWVEVVEVEDKSAGEVARRTRGIFARFGCPLEIRTDNGPCFVGQEYRAFLEGWNVRQTTSSPHYPESNGLAERMVGTVKRMWSKEQDKQLALMIYRDTPLESGKSPSELMLGRAIRTNLVPRGGGVSDAEFRAKDRELKEAQKAHTDKRHRALEQRELGEGDVVWVKVSNKDKGDRGMVVKRREEPDSYDVLMKGVIVRRNRKHLRKLNMKRPVMEEIDLGEGEDGGERVSVSGEGSESVVRAERGERRVRSRRHLDNDFEWDLTAGLGCCREMVVLRGNSMARGVRAEGVEVISRGGAKLGELMDDAERDGRVTIFLFGVPDLFRRGCTDLWTQLKRAELERQMERARGRPRWILSTAIPPRDANHSVVMCFRAVNLLAATINSANGNGTVDFHNIVYYRERGSMW